MFLESTDLTIQRRGAPRLAFPDLAIPAGAALLLLGPSGCGKTSLLSMLAGLLRPSCGTVRVEGQDFYALPNTGRDQLRGRNFGFVFQTLHLLPSLTLAQNILLAADMARAKPEPGRLAQLLSALDLADKAHRKPDALSQGEQQRAAIARAVLLRPKIIVADEPTSALDDRNAENVMTLLEAQARDTGAALLMATHDHRVSRRFEHVITLQTAEDAHS